MELMPFKNLLGLPPVSMVNSLASEYSKGITGATVRLPVFSVLKLRDKDH